MKALLVIHGYPRRYNAGSEVYTQNLAHALYDAGWEIEVFAREEDPFLPDYHMRTEQDHLYPNIPVHLVNHARSNIRFQNISIDHVFQRVVESVTPDIVHFGHLNHLSMGLPLVAKSNGIPTVFTLHDYLFMCPRGQFLQWGLTHNKPWELCDGHWTPYAWAGLTADVHTSGRIMRGGSWVTPAAILMCGPSLGCLSHFPILQLRLLLLQLLPPLLQEGRLYRPRGGCCAGGV